MFRASVLCVLLIAGTHAHTQVPYGNNPAAGKYVNVGDANIYYEEYGTGKAVILLHGGIFGYIDEFAELIPVLSKQYHVIAIATRGHGKSGLAAGRYHINYLQKIPIK